MFSKQTAAINVKPKHVARFFSRYQTEIKIIARIPALGSHKGKTFFGRLAAKWLKPLDNV